MGSRLPTADSHDKESSTGGAGRGSVVGRAVGEGAVERHNPGSRLLGGSFRDRKEAIPPLCCSDGDPCCFPCV